jgi:hypothetical protein
MTLAPLPTALSGRCSCGFLCREPHRRRASRALSDRGRRRSSSAPPASPRLIGNLVTFTALHTNSPRNPPLPAQRTGPDSRLCKGAGVRETGVRKGSIPNEGVAYPNRPAQGGADGRPENEHATTTRETGSTDGVISTWDGRRNATAGRPHHAVAPCADPRQRRLRGRPSAASALAIRQVIPRALTRAVITARPRLAQEAR